MEIKDLVLDSYGDLYVKDGDLVVAISEQQQQRLLLLMGKGELKQFPARGVGARNYIEAADNGSLSRAIRNEFSVDGMRVNSVNISMSKIVIDANY